MNGSPSSDARVSAWRTATILSLVLGYAGYYLCRSDLSVATPLIEAELGSQGIDAAALGWFATVGVGFYAVGKLFSGIACDFVGGRVLFLTAMLASIGCTWWFGASATFAMFLAAWCTNRFVQSAGWSSLVKISSNWFSYEHYGRVMSILSLSWLFGDFVGRQLLGRLISHGLGWRGVFAVAGAVLLGIFAICFFLVKETPEDVGGTPVNVNPDNVYGDEGAVRQAENLRELLAPYLRSVSFWAILVMCFCMTVIREAFNFWLPKWLTDATGIEPGLAATYSSYYPFFGGISVIMCGWISDRFLRGRRGPIIALPLLGLVPVLFMMGQHDAGLTVPTAMVFVGLSAVLMIGPYSFLGGAISLDLGGRHGSATAAGLIDTAGYAGGTVSGYVIGSIAKAHGWPAVFSTLCAFAVVAMFAAMYYWYRHEIVEHRHQSAD